MTDAHFDVIVAGLGAMGSATEFHLALRLHQFTSSWSLLGNFGKRACGSV
jgi:hypothetical protein